jgi:uncharacterized C2H2 Zn-finger protein
MQSGDKFYCPRCGAEHELTEWDRFDYLEFGRFDIHCEGCGALFRVIKDEDGTPLVH